MVFYKKLTTSLKINKKKHWNWKQSINFAINLIKINKKEEEAKWC